MKKVFKSKFLFFITFLTLSYSNANEKCFNPPQIDIIAFPNPFDEGVSLEIISLNTKVTELRVFDIIGKERQKIELIQFSNVGIYHVQLQELPAGVYFCNLYSEKRLIGSKKIVSTR
ncbi:MAG: T9SS C-terminal target domain-containing protein [Cytophagales bacterium]|nr:MAG: T9SS C-terminal target domain-containing protein [Cytophagales bacterium]